MKYKCAKCGGSVVPGMNGFIRGKSKSPDGHPSDLIPETIDALHYAEDCASQTEQMHP